MILKKVIPAFLHFLVRYMRRRHTQYVTFHGFNSCRLTSAVCSKAENWSDLFSFGIIAQ